ncbi:Thiol-disulfide isomerase or thioredoxin [Amphibacillus marinus]|uniref:Thiol-disulfide isomerase or thioredoxin n=1 Tax=Amphibacillus marinus TaxID=872970 RepID=A0A1H8RYM4_9BACI|nr:Thiol-disulfide isomerase or thioredoxin [Amphibacillus marinus]
MQAPNFTLNYLNKNESYCLSDDFGKIVVLTFWASWCPDCSNDMPLKERLFQSIDSDKVKFITINVSGRERSKADAIRYFNSFMTQPTLVDNGIEVYRKYKCLGVPTTVIIDQNGTIINQFTDQANTMEIMTALTQLI